MNYQFTRACLSFLMDRDRANLALTQPESYGNVAPLDAPGFGQLLSDILTWYPPEITYAQMNLLDSHDTARWLTIAGGDTSALDLAYLVMFTYPGAPTIYYGDEVGMQGGLDPDCRRTFLWDRAHWDDAVLTLTQRYIALRKKYAALRRGAFKTLYAADRVYAYARSRPGETVIIAVNAANTPAVFDLPLADFTRLVEEWTLAETNIYNDVAWNLRVPARTGRVWVAHQQALL